MFQPNHLTRRAAALVLPLLVASAVPAQAAAQAAGGEAMGVSLATLAAVTGSAGLAASLCTGLVVFFLGAGRRADRPDAALEDVEAANVRLAAVATRAAHAQESCAEAVESAHAAAQDAAQTVARLVAVTNETQERLRDLLANADQSQEKAAALATQCGRLTEILPDLLGGAIEAMQARGLAGMAEAAGQVRQSADMMEAAVGVLHSSAAEADGARREAAMADQAASQAKEANLTRDCDRLVNALPEIVAGALASATARHHAVLNDVADRMMERTAGLEAAAASLQDHIAGLTDAAALHVACQTSAAELAMQCDRLTRDLPGSLSAVVNNITDLDRARSTYAGDQLRDSAECMQAASAALRAGVAGLARAEADCARLGQQGAALAEQSALICEELPLRAQAAIGAIENQARSLLELVESRLQDSALGIEAAAASLHDGVQAIGETTQIPAQRLEAAVTRAEQVGQALPEISGQLARQAAELRQETVRDMQVLARAASASEQAAGVCGETLAAAANNASGTLAEMRSTQESALELVAKVTAALNALPLAAVPFADAGACLQKHTAELAAAARHIEAAAESVTTSAAACSRALPDIDNQLAYTAASLREAAERGAQTLADAAYASEQANAVGGASLAEAVREVRNVLDDMAATQQTTSALAARADAALGILPLEAGQIASAAAALREEAAGLSGAAWQIESMAAQHVQDLAAQLERPVSAIDALSAQLSAGLAGGANSMADAGAALRAQIAAGGESLAKLAAQAAEELVATARQANNSAWREEVASLAAQLDRVGPLLASGEQCASRLARAADSMAAPRPDPRSAHLEAAIAAVGAAAARLELRADAQDQAATRVAEAALAVAAAAAPAAAARLVPQFPTLARLSTLAAEAQALQSAAAELARTAVNGDPAGMPPELAKQVPAILASIESSIQGLRGTATALAIAGDAARIAA